MLFDTIETFDRNLLLSINALHTSILDEVMFYISQIWVFIPLFIFWIILILKKVEFQKMLVLLLFLGVLIALTDQTSNLTKHAVKRYRPTHNTEIGSQIHIVHEYKGGKYGFFSGHSANTFGIAMLLSLLFKKRTWLFKSQFFLWAAITAYSRMYMGVHYPSDIFVGFLVGLFWGFIVYKLILFTFKNNTHEVTNF